MTSVTNSTDTGNAILSQLTGNYDGTLDVPTVVESLLFAETGIELNSQNEDLAEYQDKLAAFELLQGGMNGFRGIMNEISTAFQDISLNGTLSDESLGSVSVSDEVSGGSYSLEVLNLASKQSITSGFYSSGGETVGAGTLTIETGTQGGSFSGNGDAVAVNVTAGMTVSDVVNEINASGAGVTAYLVNTSGGVQIAMTSKSTGLSNGFSVSVSDSDGNNNDLNGLSSLRYDDGVKNASLGQTANDANILFDGVALSSSTNNFSGSIQGFDIQVNKVNVGSPATIDVSSDIASAKDMLEEFVTAYNSVIEVFNHLKNEEIGDESKGALFRDPDLKLLERSFKKIAEEHVAGYGGSGDLGALGLKLTDANDFTIEIDETMLQAKLDTDPNAIKNALAQVALPSDPNVSFVSAESYTKSGIYSPINVTSVASVASLTGGATGSRFVGAGNDELSVTVNGESTGNVTLAGGFYGSYAELATEIENKINANLTSNSISVSYDGSAFQFAGVDKGSTYNISIDSMEAGLENSTGMTSGSSATGADMVASVGGEVAIGVGNVLEVLTGDAAGLKIKVNATTTGDYGSIELSDGIAKTFSDWVSDSFNSDGLMNQILTNYEDRIESKEERIGKLETRTEELRIRYSQEYSNINSTLIAMQQTQTQLQAQFDAWNSDN